MGDLSNMKEGELMVINTYFGIKTNMSKILPKRDMAEMHNRQCSGVKTNITFMTNGRFSKA